MQDFQSQKSDWCTMATHSAVYSGGRVSDNVVKIGQKSGLIISALLRSAPFTVAVRLRRRGPYLQFYSQYAIFPSPR